MTLDVMASQAVSFIKNICSNGHSPNLMEMQILLTNVELLYHLMQRRIEHPEYSLLSLHSPSYYTKALTIFQKWIYNQLVYAHREGRKFFPHADFPKKNWIWFNQQFLALFPKS